MTLGRLISTLALKGYYINFFLISKFGIIFLNQRGGEQVCDNNNVQETIIFYLKTIGNHRLLVQY